jgi:hypothetical protein
VPVRVPELVTGLPLTVNIDGSDKPTDVTVPLPALDTSGSHEGIAAVPLLNSN